MACFCVQVFRTLGKLLTFLYELIILFFYHLVFFSTFVLITPLCSAPPFTLWLVHCSNSVLNGHFISAVATAPEPRGARNNCLLTQHFILSLSLVSKHSSPINNVQMQPQFTFKLIMPSLNVLQHTSTQTLRIIVRQQMPSRTTFLNTGTMYRKPNAYPKEQHSPMQTMKNIIFNTNPQ